jgi:pimeloyl-ACP methyl ester carboxylesterase
VLAFQTGHGRGLAFVGHSMGGLVARLLAADPAVDAQAIVMLGSPNGGSEVADCVHRFALGRAILGPALADLRTVGPLPLPAPTCPVGIVAGTRSYLPLTSRLIAGANDGLVSLERTRLTGADWIALDAGHTLLMNHPDVAEVVRGFIKSGRFPGRLRR